MNTKYIHCKKEMVTCGLCTAALMEKGGKGGGEGRGGEGRGGGGEGKREGREGEGRGGEGRGRGGEEGGEGRGGEGRGGEGRGRGRGGEEGGEGRDGCSGQTWSHSPRHICWDSGLSLPFNVGKKLEKA